MRRSSEEIKRLVLQYEASGSRLGPNSDYTVDDLRSLVSVNIEGFLFIGQLAIKQMLAQKTGGSIVNITSTPVISRWAPLQMRSPRWLEALSVLDVESGHVLTRKVAVYAI
jgi:NAD(P)-dependent dehydrogenase (short-subunit alcohol dehydrogenase family)